MNERKQNAAPERTPMRRPGGRGRGPRPGGRAHALLPGEKARDFKGTMRQLLAYLGAYKIAIVFVMLVAAASTVFTIVGPRVLGEATTVLFDGVLAMLSGTGEIDFDTIGRILLTTLGLYLASAALGGLQGWIMAGMSADITYRFRRDIAAKINRMPFKYFDNTSQGEVLSRITNDVDTVSQTLNQSLSQIVTSVVTVVGVLIMMLTISWRMTIIALLSIPLSLLFISMVVKRSQKYFFQQQEYLGHINGHVEEMYGGHLVMKAFNGEARSVETFNQFNDTLFSSAWKSQFLSGLMMPIMRFIGNLAYVAIAVVGASMLVSGQLLLGDIQAFIQYVRSFTRPLTSIANISNILQQTAAAAERVFEFLAEEEEVPETENPVEVDGVEGRVTFDHVRFGYNEDTVVIKDFSADIEPGMKIALVGPTGAGKTTMVKLLMRFYDVDEGAIRVDGHDVKDFRREDLRCMFGMVLQDTWLYNDTIMENIRYGRPDATDEEVCRAAKAAHVDHFVRTLPEGYNLVVNEEATNISQGQKQLLTIARAIVTDPRMLILDEATSSVDTRTEVLIQEAMDTLMKGRTSFIIAHRLSTIRNADWILVMDEGDVVEQGVHEDLLTQDGFYAELYNSQFEGLVNGA